LLIQDLVFGHGWVLELARSSLWWLIRSHYPKLPIHLSQFLIVFCLLLLLLKGLIPFLITNVGTQASRELFGSLISLPLLFILFHTVGLVSDLTLGFLLARYEVWIHNSASVLQHIAIMLLILTAGIWEHILGRTLDNVRLSTILRMAHCFSWILLIKHF